MLMAWKIANRTYPLGFCNEFLLGSKYAFLLKALITQKPIFP